MNVNLNLKKIEGGIVLIIYLKHGGAFVVPVKGLDDYIKLECIEPGPFDTVSYIDEEPKCRWRVSWCKFCDVSDIDYFEVTV